MKPPHAAAIRIFDYFAAMVYGLVAAVAASTLVPGVLPAPLAMLLGMIIGVVCAFLLLGFFSYLLAGLELVMLAMQVGMIAGMAGAMLTGPILQVAWGGALIGFVVHLFIHIADWMMEGEVRT